MKGRSETTRSRALQIALGGLRGRLQSAQASQVLEFALVLPMLVVLVVGAADFGAGWTLKDKLTEATREGARIAISQPNDLSQGAPPASVTAARDAVNSSLTNANLTTCTLGTSATSGDSYGAWSYSFTGTGCSSAVLLIERANTFTVGGSTVQATRVTLSYPFTWNFAQVIKLLAPTSTYANSITLSSTVVMENLN